MESNTGASYGGSGSASSSTNTGGDVISGGGGGGGAGLSNAINDFDTNVELSLEGSTLTLKRPFNQVSDGLESVTSGTNKLLKTKVDGSTVTLVSGVLTGGYIAGNGMNISGNTISSTFNNNSGATECVSVNANGTNTTLGVANLSAKTTTLNVGHSAATVNVRGSQINLGSAGDTVNIAGNLTFVNSTQTTIQDKAITLNKTSLPVSTAASSGIELEEGVIGGVGSLSGGNNFFSLTNGTFLIEVNAAYYAIFQSAPNAQQRFYFTSFNGNDPFGVSLNTPYYFQYFSTSAGSYFFKIYDVNGTVVVPDEPNFVYQYAYAYYSLNSTAGYVKTSADRNSWVLKAPGKAGAMTIPMRDSDVTVDFGAGIQSQVVFTTAGSTSTWTVPSGVTSIVLEMVGGGGSGSSAGTSNATPGSGGGAGQYRKIIFPVSGGGVISYTIGAGGAALPATPYQTAGNAGSTTTISYAIGGTTTLTATCAGGNGGVATAGTNSGLSGSGGSSGTITTSLTYSQVVVTGGDGYPGSITGGGNPGNGGSSYFGGGGGYNSASGQAGRAYGSGGCGALSGTSGAGAGGVVIITYFSNAVLPNTYTPVAPLSFSGSNLIYSPLQYCSLFYNGISVGQNQPYLGANLSTPFNNGFTISTSTGIITFPTVVGTYDISFNFQCNSVNQFMGIGFKNAAGTTIAYMATPIQTTISTLSNRAFYTSTASDTLYLQNFSGSNLNIYGYVTISRIA